MKSKQVAKLIQYTQFRNLVLLDGQQYPLVHSYLLGHVALLLHVTTFLLLSLNASPCGHIAENSLKIFVNDKSFYMRFHTLSAVLKAVRFSVKVIEIATLTCVSKSPTDSRSWIIVKSRKRNH